MKKALDVFLSPTAAFLFIAVISVLAMCLSHLGAGSGVYSSWWFILLLVLLWLQAAGVFARSILVARSAYCGSAHADAEPAGTVSLDGEDAMSLVRSALGGYRITETEDNGQTYIRAERFSFAVWGRSVFWLGILVLMTSGFLGFIFGTYGRMAVNESAANSGLVTANGRTVKLPFSIRLDNTDTKYYKDSYILSSFRSDISVGGDKAAVSAGSPAVYKGYGIYQTDRGFFANPKVVFSIVTGINSNLKKVDAVFGRRFVVPGTGLTGEILDFAPSLGQDGSGRLVNYDTPMMNPAALLALYDPDGKMLGTKWLFMQYPESGDFKAFKVVFADVTGVQYAIFSIVKDPFRQIALAGFVMVFIGCLLTFVFRHTRFCVRYNPTDGAVCYSVPTEGGNIKPGWEAVAAEFIKALGR